MQIYLVGGAVRDLLMGIDSQDLDYVVVGCSIQEMLALGYIPVGKDFPVFLHPITKNEYALARTERKTAQGYQGFKFYTDKNITLEQDLLRRDLTINAMALPVDNHHQQLSLDNLIDPFNGKKDLENKILRHISLSFSEDPVRILRVARFAARYNFSVYDNTLKLMQNMTDSGEVDALVSERVWQEINKGLAEKYPHKLLEVLYNCGALHVILPEFIIDFEQHIKFLKFISKTDTTINHIDADKIFLCILLHIGLCRNTNISPICINLKLRKELIDISKIIAKLYKTIIAVTNIAHFNKDYYNTTLDVIEIGDAIRRQDRFNYILDICMIYAEYYHNIDIKACINHIKNCLYICINIDSDEIITIVENAKKYHLDIKSALNELRLHKFLD